MVSIYPCDVHGRRVPGRLGAAYVTLTRGTTKRSRRMRVCSPCLGDILQTYDDEWTPVGLEDTVPVAEMCGSCKAPLTEIQDPWGCFVTTFSRGDERADYFGWYCERDAEGLATSLGLEYVLIPRGAETSRSPV